MKKSIFGAYQVISLMKQAYINKDTKFAASSGLHKYVIFPAYAERISLEQINQKQGKQL